MIAVVIIPATFFFFANAIAVMIISNTYTIANQAVNPICNTSTYTDLSISLWERNTVYNNFIPYPDHVFHIFFHIFSDNHSGFLPKCEFSAEFITVLHGLVRSNQHHAADVLVGSK